MLYFSCGKIELDEDLKLSTQVIMCKREKALQLQPESLSDHRSRGDWTPVELFVEGVDRLDSRVRDMIFAT